ADLAIDGLGDQYWQGQIGDHRGGTKGGASCADTCQRAACNRRAGPHAGEIRLYQFRRIARCGRAGFGGYSRSRRNKGTRDLRGSAPAGTRTITWLCFKGLSHGRNFDGTTMATKTSSKTATRKSAAHTAAHKTTARQPVAAPKTKVLKKELKRDVAREHADPAAPAKSTTLSPKTEPRTAPARSHEHESVSLIDRKKPRKKAEDGEVKPKRVVLPPISRIRASLEATVAPPKPPVPVEAPAPAPPTQAPAEPVTPSAEPEAEPQKIILIKPPIVVKHLAAELGLKPHQLIAELMMHNIFANINQTIEPDIAAKIAENHGFILEKERREKGAGVHKVEQPVVAPPLPVIEKKEELKPRAPIITF